MWVRWEGGKPVEYIVCRPGERLPESDKLSHTDEKKWETGPDGDPKDSWANTRLVYLVDPDTAEAFTFSTSSWGGRAAVAEVAAILQTNNGDEHPMAAMLRTLLSEGRIDREVAITQRDGVPKTIHVRRNGPVALILTSGGKMSTRRCRRGC